MSDRWYRKAPAEEPLTQGDIIFSCPVVGWRRDVRLDFSSGQEVLPVGELLDAQRVDVIVMTQACDLEHAKVRNVVLCPLYRLSLQGGLGIGPARPGPESDRESVEALLRRHL